MAKTAQPQEMIRWTLEWSNPYTQPPEGMPRFLAEEITPRYPYTKPHNLEKMTAIGDGYAVCFHLLTVKPRRQLSEETKQGIRRKALARRMKEKQPLFADAAISAALAAQPDYYGLVPSAELD